MKLILTAGMSGAGKSTTSKRIYQSLLASGQEAIWLHEECHNHPIRWSEGGEFRQGDLSTYEGMALNLMDYEKRWKSFLHGIRSENRTYVMEGCIFQPIIRYFFNSCFEDWQIKAFYKKFFSWFKDIDLTLVYLHCPNVKAVLEAAFESRGKSWENLIMSNEDAYYDKHPYTGPESVFAMWEDYRNLSDQIFEGVDHRKIRLTVPSNKDWQANMIQLHDFLGLKIQTQKPLSYSFPTGDLVNPSGQDIGMSLCMDDKGYYLSTEWFQRIALECRDQRRLEASSFPITLVFEQRHNRVLVEILGNYGWDFNDQKYVLKKNKKKH